MLSISAILFLLSTQLFVEGNRRSKRDEDRIARTYLKQAVFIHKPSSPSGRVVQRGVNHSLRSQVERQTPRRVSRRQRSASSGLNFEHPASKVAAYWSQLHLNSEHTLEHQNRVALIVTGQLRFESEQHVTEFEEAARGTTCFVVTYDEFRALASRLSPNVMIVALSELEQEQTRLEVDKMPGTVWQWFLLARAVDHWRERLENFTTIVRFRTDLRLYPGFQLEKCVGRIDSSKIGIVYAESDIFFYSSGETFLRLFGKFMYTMVTSQYMEPEPTKPQLEAFKRAMREFGGFEYSCLLGKDFAPSPRLRGLRPDNHATAFVSTEQATKMSRIAQRFFHSQPDRASVDRSRRTLLSNGPSSYVKEVWCGCKVGQAWRLGKSGKRFHSEAAFSYHIYTHGASCLPLDFHHREVISVHPNRSLFDFVPHRSNESLLDDDSA